MKCPEEWQERLTEFRKRLRSLEAEFSICVEPAASADDDSNMQTWLEYVAYSPTANGFKYGKTIGDSRDGE